MRDDADENFILTPLGQPHRRTSCLGVIASKRQRIEAHFADGTALGLVLRALRDDWPLNRVCGLAPHLAAT